MCAQRLCASVILTFTAMAFGSVLSFLSLSNRNVERAWMAAIVKQSDRHLLRLLRGFLGDDAPNVIVLLRECRLNKLSHRCDDETQTRARFYFARNKRKMLKLIGECPIS